jgi:hypothetical protein
MAKMLRKKKRPISSDSEEEVKRDRHIISDVDLNEAGDEDDHPRNLVGSVVKGTLAKKEKVVFEPSENVKKKTKFRPSFQKK